MRKSSMLHKKDPPCIVTDSPHDAMVDFMSFIDREAPASPGSNGSVTFPHPYRLEILIEILILLGLTTLIYALAFISIYSPNP